MKISVVITAYNLEEFIAEAIDSALAQTVQPHEVIVVNDASTDGTNRVIRGYGDRVRYISLPANVGALRAALAGLDQASGEFVAFLDGDDVWRPTKLEKCLALFRTDDDMMLVSHQHSRVDREGRALDIVDETHRNIDRIIRTIEPEGWSAEFKRSILEKLGYWLGSAYVFRRAALDLNDFKAWVETLPSPGDVYLDLTIAPYLVLANPAKNVGIVDERLFDYRIHGGNSCNDFRGVDQALRSVRRGYYTTLAADALNERFAALPMAQRGHRAHLRALRYYEFLEALYRNRRIEASRVFVGLVAAGYFSPRGFLKESARLGIIWVGGVSLFLRIKARRGA